jgi:hypothetical protein
MATFQRVRIEADKEKFPVLLSNGNLVEEGECTDENGAKMGRKFAIWHGEHSTNENESFFCKRTNNPT